MWLLGVWHGVRGLPTAAVTEGITVTKKLFFSVICSRPPGGVRVGEQAGAQQAGGCDHRGVLALGWGPETENPGASTLSCFLSYFCPWTQRCLLVLTFPRTLLSPFVWSLSPIRFEPEISGKN